MNHLLKEFLTETAENMGILEEELVKLEQNPNDSSLLDNIFRLVHTIKGTCRFLGLPRLESVAHAVENVLGKIRDGEIDVTPVAVSLILEGIDRIKLLLHELEANEEEPEGEDSDPISRLNAFADGTVVEAAEDRPAPAKENSPSIVAELEVSGRVGEREPPHGQKTGSVTSRTTRVNVALLESLMTMISELVLTRNQLMQMLRNETESEFSAPLQRLSHVTTELQEAVMKIGMLPIGSAWSKMPRIVRDLSIELDKKIDLQMIGADTELDSQMLELIKDPLTHMVRNAADHGIEMPKDRLASGKPETGTITLNACHEGGHIRIEISDDGKGLNTARIREKVLETGLVSESDMRSLSTQQIQQFVFNAGLSTAAAVTFVSGRGVGMDVVKTNIEKTGGAVEVRSTEGVGTTFSIKVPLTLAVVSALNAENAGERSVPPVSIAPNPLCTLARSGFRAYGARNPDAAPHAVTAVTGSRCRPTAGQKIGSHAGKSGVTP
ncbi:MAG: chemotaxis protein CheA [Alphaproteobacteria bacterium]